MEKYEPKEGGVIFSEEEIKLLREAKKIISEASTFACGSANSTNAPDALEDLDYSLDKLCSYIESTGGNFPFDAYDD